MFITVWYFIGNYNTTSRAMRLARSVTITKEGTSNQQRDKSEAIRMRDIIFPDSGPLLLMVLLTPAQVQISP